MRIYTPTSEEKKLYGSLLALVWKKHGGLTAVASMLDIPRQFPDNWRKLGWVPLRKVGDIARTLNENHYALNYPQMILLIGDTAPRWREVVESLGLPHSTEVDRLLKEYKKAENVWEFL